MSFPVFLRLFAPSVFVSDDGWAGLFSGRASGVGVVRRSLRWGLLVVGVMGTGTEVRGQADTLTLSVGAHRMEEGVTGTMTAQVPVHLSAPATALITVSWTTADETATSGSDYTAASGTLEFQPGESVRTVAVAVHGDGLDEMDETFVVRLSDPVGARLGQDVGRVLIVADELVTAVSLPATAAAFENLAASVPPTALIGNPTATRQARGVILNGTATIGTDFALDPASGDLDLSKTSTPLPVRMTNDALDETDETYAFHVPEPGPGVRMLPGSPEHTVMVSPAATRVAVDNSLLAVIDAGNLKIWRREAQGWVEDTVISGAADGGATALALDQGLLAADFPATGVKLFEKINGSWTVVAVLPRQSAEPDAGRTLALQDDTLAIGDPGSALDVASSGRVWIHERHAGGTNAWGLQSTLDPIRPRPDFGGSLALWGERLAVGSAQAFAVTLYERRPDTRQWGQVGELVRFVTDFGRALALDGSLLAVPSPRQLVMLARVPETGVWTEQTATYSTLQTATQPVMLRRGLLCVVAGNAVTYIARPPTAFWAIPGPFLGSPISVTRPMIAYDGHTLVLAGAATDAGVPLNIQGPPLASGTIIDDETIRFTVDDAMTDSPVWADFYGTTVHLSRPLALEVMVTISSLPGTAEPGSDYLASSGNYRFEPGQTSQFVGFTAFSPEAGEGVESFSLSMSQPTVGQTGPDATITIIPPPPNIGFTGDNISVAEGDTGITAVPLTLQLTGPAPVGASYKWEVSGTYSFLVAGSGVVTVPAGATTSTFDVLIKGDTVPSISTWFTVQLVSTEKIGRTGTVTSQFISVVNDDGGTPVDDAYAMTQGQVLSGVNVVSNDEGMGYVKRHLAPTKGGLNLGPAGDFIYTPLPNFFGRDTFQYRDEYELPNVPPLIGTVVIEVADARIPPVLQADGDSILAEETVRDQSQPTSPSLFANDGLFDSAGVAFDPILEVRAVDVKNGKVTDMERMDGRFKFTPDLDFAGLAGFSYQVRDKDGWSLPAAVRFQVRDDLDIGPLQRVGPQGSQLFAAIANSVSIPATGTIDHLLALRAGQTLSILVGITGDVPIGKLEVVNAAGQALTGGVRSGNSLEHLPIPEDGTYKLLMGDRGSSGRSRVSVLVNGGLSGQPTDPALPYSLDTARGKGSLRAAVFTSTVAATATPHHYSFTAAAGETVRLLLHSNPAQKFTLTTPTGDVLAQSAVHSGDPLSASLQYTMPAAGACRVVVQGLRAATYSLELYPENHTYQALPGRPPLVTRAATGSLDGASAATAAPPEGSFSFAAFADYGTGNSDQGAVATMVKSWQPDFLVAAGDHNYTLGYAVGEATWGRNVGAFYGEFIKRRLDNRYPEQTSLTQRFFPVPGNHDSGPDSSNGGELSSYLDYFHSNPGGEPRIPDGVHRPRLSYYKMSWGAADFFFLDSDNAMVNTAARETQRQWLREQIAASGARWKFGVWHHPPYSSGGVHGSQLLLQWGADLQGLTAVITGHDHIYERLDMGYGVTQFIVGLGGSSIYQLADRPVPQSLVRYNASRGALRGQVGPEGVRFEYWAVSPSGSVLIDSLTVGTPPGIPLASGTDTWSLPVRRGETVRLATRTPLPPGRLSHDVNPALALVDADGRIVATAVAGAADGRNAVMQYAIPGSPASPDEMLPWTVRVQNEASGSGEYELFVGSPALDAYNAWMAGRVPADDDGPEQDPDRDGLPSLLEFLLNSDPSVAAIPAVRPLVAEATEPLSLRLHLPASWERPVVAQLESTASLVDDSWTTVATKTPNGPWTSPNQTIPVAHPDGGFTLAVPSALPTYYRLSFSLSE